MPETLPIEADLIVFLDTDNPYEFEVYDENNVRIDVTGYLANLQVAKTEKDLPILDIECAVVVDPLDATKTILTCTISDDMIQPVSEGGVWSPKDYVYSLKRMNPGNEKILRLGSFIARRARK
jgi:uncharacterized membrane protein